MMKSILENLFVIYQLIFIFTFFGVTAFYVLHYKICQISKNLIGFLLLCILAEKWKMITKQKIMSLNKNKMLVLLLGFSWFLLTRIWTRIKIYIPFSIAGIRSLAGKAYWPSQTLYFSALTTFGCKMGCLHCSMITLVLSLLRLIPV